MSKHCVKYLSCLHCELHLPFLYTAELFTHANTKRGEKFRRRCKCVSLQMHHHIMLRFRERNKRKESVRQSEISADQCRCSTHINFKVAQNSQYEPVYFHLCTTVLQGVTWNRSKADSVYFESCNNNFMHQRGNEIFKTLPWLASCCHWQSIASVRWQNPSMLARLWCSY